MIYLNKLKELNFWLTIFGISFRRRFLKEGRLLSLFLPKDRSKSAHKASSSTSLGIKTTHFLSALFFFGIASPNGHTKGEIETGTDKISGIRAGLFQKDFTWVAIDNLENGTLVFFDKLMVPVLCLKNVGKIIDFRIDKSLLSTPLLEIEFERHFTEGSVVYSAIVGELFEIHDDKVSKLYSYTKQLLYTVRKEGEYRQIIFKGMLKADEIHKNTVKLIIQTNQAIPTLKASYLVDQFTVDDTAQGRSFKYHVTFPDTAQLDRPPLNIDLLGGGTTYKMINNINKKK